MVVDDSMVEWFFRVIVGGILTLGAWLWKGLVGDVRALEKDQSQYKLYAQQTFAKDNTMQSTLSRLHERLDSTATKDDVFELRNDIKNIMMVSKK